jgi:hypothetical protein
MRRVLVALLVFISSNVPAVNDGLAARISKRKNIKYHSYPVFALAGLTNCGGEKYHKGRIARLVFFVA